MEEASLECSFRQQEAIQSVSTCTSIEQVESTSYNLNVPFHEESFQVQVHFGKQETTPIATSIEQVHSTTSYSLNVPCHEVNQSAISSEDETIQMINNCASTQTFIPLINSTPKNTENIQQEVIQIANNCTITEQIDTQTSNSTVGSTEEVSSSNEASLQRHSTEEELIQVANNRTNNITNTKHISSSLNSSTSDNQNEPFQGASYQVHSSKQDTIPIAICTKQNNSISKNINMSSFHVENLPETSISLINSISENTDTIQQGTSSQQEVIQAATTTEQINLTSESLNESSLPTQVNCNSGSINTPPSSSFDFIELAQHKTEIKAAIISLKTNLVLGVVIVLLFLVGVTARNSNTILGALLKGIIPIATAISNFVVVRDILKAFWNKYVPLCFLK